VLSPDSFSRSLWEGNPLNDLPDQLDDGLEAVKQDTLLHFADPDLNGVWRRRILEFENNKAV